MPYTLELLVITPSTSEVWVFPELFESVADCRTQIEQTKAMMLEEFAALNSHPEFTILECLTLKGSNL